MCAVICVSGAQLHVGDCRPSQPSKFAGPEGSWAAAVARQVSGCLSAAVKLPQVVLLRFQLRLQQNTPCRRSRERAAHIKSLSRIFVLVTVNLRLVGQRIPQVSMTQTAVQRLASDDSEYESAMAEGSVVHAM